MKKITPEDPLLQKIVEGARTNLKNSEILLPTFFIGGENGVEIIGADFRDDKMKDQVAQTVRRIAMETRAEFVVFVSEAWSIPPEDAEGYMKAPLRRIMDHPRAFEIVSFNIETRNGDLSGIAKILPNREMGPVEWTEIPVGNMSGRFSGFLGPRKV